ncbi:TPA: hypothetical protein ACI00M_002603 [Cronobacter dublinensis]
MEGALPVILVCENTVHVSDYWVRTRELAHHNVVAKVSVVGSICTVALKDTGQCTAQPKFREQ